eukprot:1850696-Prymnesium_polylepis.1
MSSHTRGVREDRRANRLGSPVTRAGTASRGRRIVAHRSRPPIIARTSSLIPVEKVRIRLGASGGAASLGVKCGREAGSFEWPDHWPT